MLRPLRRLSALIFSPAAVLKACNLTVAAPPVTQPPHLAQRQPRKWAGFGALAAVSSATVQKGFSAMNFRILAASAWPRGRVLALLAATALTATCLVPDANAQTPAPGAPAAPPKAAPMAAPKAAPKAAPAPAPAPAAQ